MGDKNYVDIYRVNSNGEDLIQLTNTYKQDESPIFTPDGEKIIYRDKDSSLYIMDTDGSNQKRLMLGPAAILGWSPDGKKGLLIKDISTDLFVMDLETKNLSRLTFDGSNTDESTASFSPDGQWISFTGIGDLTGIQYYTAWENVFIMPADGSQKPSMLGISDYHGSRFTPDGKQIVFHGWQKNQDPQKDTPHYYAIQLNGFGLTILSDKDFGLVYGKWQPYSTFPAFSGVPSSVVAPTPTPVSTWNPFSIDTPIVEDMPLVNKVIREEKFDIPPSSFELNGNYSLSNGILILGKGAMWSNFKVKQYNGYLLLFRVEPDTSFYINFEYGPFNDPSYHAFWLDSGDIYWIWNGKKNTRETLDFEYLPYTWYYLLMWLDTNGVKGITWEKEHPGINENFYAETGKTFVNSELNFVINLFYSGSIEIDEFQELEFTKK